MRTFLMAVLLSVHGLGHAQADVGLVNLVAGDVVVKDGRHRDEDAVFARYRAAMARLSAMP